MFNISNIGVGWAQSKTSSYPTRSCKGCTEVIHTSFSHHLIARTAMVHKSMQDSCHSLGSLSPLDGKNQQFRCISRVVKPAAFAVAMPCVWTSIHVEENWIVRLR